jgi:Lon-like protease
VIGAVIVAALLGTAFLIPIPSMVVSKPGPTRDVELLVDVDGTRTYSSEGSLYLTTVGIDLGVTFADWIAAAINPDQAVLSRASITQGLSLEELKREQEQQMDASQRDAAVVALGALGRAAPQGDGAPILSVVSEPAVDDLKPGDEIVSFEGEEVSTVCELLEGINSHEPGDLVELGVRRTGRVIEEQLRLAENPVVPGAPIVGVTLDMSAYDFDPGFDYRFDTGPVSRGPSAGLMFSLGLYDRLTADDLTGGRKIAGTGTITCDGRVGPIGGVEQKVAAAKAVGAEVFLAPELNALAARSVADGIEIVPVKTFEDALEYLQSPG